MKGGSIMVRENYRFTSLMHELDSYDEEVIKRWGKDRYNSGFRKGVCITLAVIGTIEVIKTAKS